MKKRNGWGLVKRGRVTEVVICKRKPHPEVFFDGQYSSQIIPVKITYELKKNKR